MALSFSAGEIS